MNLVEKIIPDKSTSLFVYLPILCFRSQEEEEDEEHLLT